MKNSITLPIHFAPLQGYTDAVYRNAHAAIFGGVDTYYTPFVRIERGGFRAREQRDVAPQKNSVPHLIPQLIAADVEKAEQILALFIEKGYTQASINMGCPFPILAKRHQGSGILPSVERVESLLSIVSKYPEVRFSVKMRLGWDNPNECLALAPLLNSLPLQHITMHARLGNQQYKGEVDLDGFAAFAHVCNHPLIYNGDIGSMEQMDSIALRFPHLAGIMLGRGLLANPALALEYKQGAPLAPNDLADKLRTLHTELLANYQEQMQGGDSQLVAKMKTIWEYLLPHGDRKLKKAIHKANKLETYQQAVNLLIASLKQSLEEEV